MFKANDVVECIKQVNGCFTKGKLYTVDKVATLGNYMTIRDGDAGKLVGLVDWLRGLS